MAAIGDKDGAAGGPSKSDDDLLAEAAGRLGAAGGEFTLELGAATGGRLGGRWAARRMSNNVLEVDLELALPSAAIVGRAVEVFEQLGKVVDSCQDDGAMVVRGMFDSGWLDLCPAIVTVRVSTTGGEGTSRVTIRGVAKEGLIKQRAGEKAARKVAELLVA